MAPKKTTGQDEVDAYDFSPFAKKAHIKYVDGDTTRVMAVNTKTVYESINALHCGSQLNYVSHTLKSRLTKYLTYNETKKTEVDEIFNGDDIDAMFGYFEKINLFDMVDSKARAARYKGTLRGCILTVCRFLSAFLPITGRVYTPKRTWVYETLSKTDSKGRVEGQDSFAENIDIIDGLDCYALKYLNVFCTSPAADPLVMTEFGQTSIPFFYDQPTGRALRDIQTSVSNDILGVGSQSTAIEHVYANVRNRDEVLPILEFNMRYTIAHVLSKTVPRHQVMDTVVTKVESSNRLFKLFAQHVEAIGSTKDKAIVVSYTQAGLSIRHVNTDPGVNKNGTQRAAKNEYIKVFNIDGSQRTDYATRFICRLLGIEYTETTGQAVLVNIMSESKIPTINQLIRSSNNISTVFMQLQTTLKDEESSYNVRMAKTFFALIEQYVVSFMNNILVSPKISSVITALFKQSSSSKKKPSTYTKNMINYMGYDQEVASVHPLSNIAKTYLDDKKDKEKVKEGLNKLLEHTKKYFNEANDLIQATVLAYLRIPYSKLNNLTFAFIDLNQPDPILIVPPSNDVERTSVYNWMRVIFVFNAFNFYFHLQKEKRLMVEKLYAGDAAYMKSLGITSTDEAAARIKEYHDDLWQKVMFEFINY